jgi:hypothetical protein
MPKNPDNTESKGVLSKIKDKITSVSGIITGLCAITAFLWMAFREVQSYNDSKISVQEQQVQIDSLISKVTMLEEAAKTISSTRSLDAFDLGIAYEIIVENMPDYYYEGVRYKLSNDGKKVYYYVKGILYRAGWDNASQKYFYTAEDGKTYWCK